MASWRGDNDVDPLHAYSSGNDLTVLKLDSNGNYAWHTFYGANGTNDNDVGNRIAVDGAG